jgi:enoyl-CoA hydratase/carnithine racemase
MVAVKYSVADRIARITLARPEALNATNRELGEGVGTSVTQAVADPDVHVVLLDAQGRAFCAGADLKDANTHNAHDIIVHMAPSRSGLDLLGGCTKPVVAAVQGYCVGAGVEMAISADVTIAAEDAIFFLPQVKLGILPGAGGVSRLVRRIGEPWAARMALLGERIDAQTALRIGLVTEVVARDALETRSREIAAVLADVPPAAVQLTKESINQSYDVPLSAGLMADKYRLFVLSGTPEKEASHAAFRNRDAAATGS